MVNQFKALPQEQVANYSKKLGLVAYTGQKVLDEMDQIRDLVTSMRSLKAEQKFVQQQECCFFFFLR